MGREQRGERGDFALSIFGRRDAPTKSVPYSRAPEIFIVINSRSLITVRAFGWPSRIKPSSFAGTRIKRRLAHFDLLLCDEEIQLSSGPCEITGISQPKASKMKST